VYYFSGTSNQVSVVTEKFVFDKWSSNIRLTISAPVSNSWFSLSATLVNAATGKEYNIEQGVEFYSGVSEGESWSEGSTSEDVYLTRIPAGTYFFQLQGTREGYSFSTQKINNFQLTALYDVPSARNIWVTILLLVIWPVGFFLWTGYRERQRWADD
jgi:hypothetical protein